MGPVGRSGPRAGGAYARRLRRHAPVHDGPRDGVCHPVQPDDGRRAVRGQHAFALRCGPQREPGAVAGAADVHAAGGAGQPPRALRPGRAHHDARPRLAGAVRRARHPGPNGWHPAHHGRRAVRPERRGSRLHPRRGGHPRPVLHLLGQQQRRRPVPVDAPRGGCQPGARAADGGRLRPGQDGGAGHARPRPAPRHSIRLVPVAERLPRPQRHAAGAHGAQQPVPAG